jgi:hypothetical protein
MVYNSHATNLDCVSEILRICGTTVAGYPLNDITRRFNSSLDEYFSLAFQSDGRWSFDDINETSPPIDTQDIVNGTNRYKFGTFTETVINLIKLEILDGDGNGHSLIKEDWENLGQTREGNESGVITGVNQDTFQELYLDPASGRPTHYIKYGDFVYLRPSPNYSETAGLKAFFNRPASYMAATDTTKIPGVPVLHHTALCRMTALPYLIENQLPHATIIAQLVQQDKLMIEEHFAQRTKDMKSKMIPTFLNNK